MKHYRIEITELAEQDLENASDHIAFELKNPSLRAMSLVPLRLQLSASVPDLGNPITYLTACLFE